MNKTFPTKPKITPPLGYILNYRLKLVAEPSGSALGQPVSLPFLIAFAV
jgi:hypothetical protein